MKVIVPCAGRSSRYPNMPPKWMLPDHDGIPMVVRALEGLPARPDDLVFTLLREHEERFDAVAGLERAFGQKVNCVVLEKPTASQSETVMETIRRANVSEPFLVKDSDNFFELSSIEETYNYVTVSSLNDFEQINARNKSYVQIDQDGVIINIREKQVISDLFSVGGYFFNEPDAFLATFDELRTVSEQSGTELYISEIISHMILNGGAFQAKRAQRYQDWGTVHEWRAKLERHRVFLISIDGFLFERGSRYFEPAFEEVAVNPGAAEAVREMAGLHHTVIYLSIRPPELETLTRAQLRSHDLPDGQIIFGCGVAQWALVTAAHPSLPFDTSRAFEITPDDVNILDKLELHL
jgi:dTDP-glucose pyrophosphorylase